MDLSLTKSSDDLSEGGIDLVPLQQTCNKYRAHIVLNMFTLLMCLLVQNKVSKKDLIS
jgi:hypothetical protein